MGTRISKGIALEQELWDKIEKTKGEDVSTSAYVRRVLKEKLGA